MDIKRFVLTQGVVLEDKTIIPIWDSRLSWEKSEMYGQFISFNGSSRVKDIYNVVECIFDLKTKTISRGIEVDIYPNLEDLLYTVGQVILFENSSKNFLTKIKDIVFENYDMNIKKGKKIDNWDLKRLNADVVIDSDGLYCIKTWKPCYILENGCKTEYGFQIKKIENLDYIK